MEPKAKSADDSNLLDLSRLEGALDAVVSESDNVEEEVEPWLLPGVAEGVQMLIGDDEAPEVCGPSCGIRSCNLLKCRQATLGPLGSFGPSIWSESLIHDSLLEWKMPIDPKIILKGSLVATFACSPGDACSSSQKKVIPELDAKSTNESCETDAEKSDKCTSESGDEVASTTELA